MTDFAAFKTRDKANEGIRLPLSLPDGTPTEHWLQIRSVWSDTYQGARSELLRQALEHGKEVASAGLDEAATKARRKELDRLRRATLAASLISGWSNEQELSEDNLVAFLLDAPQILVHVERIAEDDKRFFGN